MLHRNITKPLLAALRDTPVVYLAGARQTGKSTLAREVCNKAYPAQYITFDEATWYSAATTDPSGFLKNLTGPAILDEVQRVPSLFRAIKAEVDRNRNPGRFLLTGSAGPMIFPQASEALAGRMEVLTLWPFSQGEISGVTENFIDAVFSKSFKPLRAAPEKKQAIIGKILDGGFPEPLSRKDPSRKRAWFESYVASLLQREIREITNVEHAVDLPRILRLGAARSASLLNISEWSRTLAIPNTTLQRHLALLGGVFLILTIPAWSLNSAKRLVKTPKIFLTDTGMLSNLLDLTAERLARDPNGLGPLLENFIAAELTKQVEWSSMKPGLFHYRTHTGKEVDFLLENRAGEIVGLEVKASASVSGADFHGLKALAETVGKRFCRGIILYLGTERVPFGQGLFALPVSDLWHCE